MTKTDWGTAPEPSSFYGRVPELKRLSQWILEERSRLVVIRGMRGTGKTHLAVGFGRRGIGKTDLTLSFAEKVKEHFHYIIWRSLLNAPPLPDLLRDLVYFLSDGAVTVTPPALQDNLDLLMGHLVKARCLIILDNLESILRGRPNRMDFREGFEDYENLFRRLIDTSHVSCMLVNGRESPKSLDRLCGRKTPARLLSLRGLDQASSKKLISDQGRLVGERSIRRLIDYYGGNPLALQLAAKYIEAVYVGDVERFLASEDGIFNDIKEQLDWHFDRLTDAEKELMLCLALSREPMAVEELKSDILNPFLKQTLGDTIQSFQRRLPLEKTGVAFTLQPVLIEYATERYISEAASGILALLPLSIDKHLLYKAQAKDHVRDVQDRVILDPIIELLLATLRDHESLSSHLAYFIQAARRPKTQGYAIGNVINLMRRSGISCSGRDFSRLVIRQAFLQFTLLHDADLTKATILKSVFTSTLGAVLTLAVDTRREGLLSGDAAGQIRLWSMRDGTELRSYQGHTSWVRSLAVSPNGVAFASGSSDYTVRIWSMDSGDCRLVLRGHADQVYSVSYHPNGQVLASGGEDQRALLWSVETGEIVETIEAQRGRVRSVCFSPRGDLIAVAATTVALWDLQMRETVYTLRTGDRYVRQIVFSRDGEYLFVLDEEGPILVFGGRMDSPLARIRLAARLRCIAVSPTVDSSLVQEMMAMFMFGIGSVDGRSAASLGMCPQSRLLP